MNRGLKTTSPNCIFPFANLFVIPTRMFKKNGKMLQLINVLTKISTRRFTKIEINRFSTRGTVGFLFF